MNELQSEEEFEQSSKVGRLEELNGHGSLTGKLWEANGTKWTCFFKPKHVALLPEAWMHRVKITGRALVEEGKEHALEVDSISILDQGNVSGAGQTERSSFWHSLSLEELAAQQSVTAADDLDAIAALWPVDDDPDELLQHILRERGERRKLHKNRGEAE